MAESDSSSISYLLNIFIYNYTTSLLKMYTLFNSSSKLDIITFCHVKFNHFSSLFCREFFVFNLSNTSTIFYQLRKITIRYIVSFPAICILKLVVPNYSLCQTFRFHFFYLNFFCSAYFVKYALHLNCGLCNCVYSIAGNDPTRKLRVFINKDSKIVYIVYVNFDPRSLFVTHTLVFLSSIEDGTL